MTDYVVGVDIGTQSTKAILCDARGRIVAQHASAYAPDTPRPRWAEQWPAVWLDAVVATVAACVRTATASEPGFAPSQMRGICISSLYGGSGIPVDEAMQPVHPCLIWMDRRAIAQVDWVKRNVDLEWLYDITGNSVDSYYGYTKMMWLRDERPDVWKRTRWLLPPNAWVIHALTGEIAVDHSSAGNIGGIYDLERGTWSQETCAALGLDPGMLPDRLVRSSDTVGTLTREAAQRLGLAEGTPVIAGGVDAAVATFAAGVTRAGQHVAMIGSSMCWGYITPHVDPRRGLVSMPYVYGSARDRYVFGGAITAGASVTWFRNVMAQHESAAATTDVVDLHATLESEARDVPPGADGIVFLPYLMGERSPVWDGEASGAFVGLNLYHHRAHLYRAVLEGVAYSLRHNIDAGTDSAIALEAPLGIVGGAARSDLWMQVIADVTGREVRTLTEDVEAAIGAALLAAYGVGLVSEADVARGWVTFDSRAKPRQDAMLAYDRGFEVYKSLYPALRDAMHALARA